MNKYIKIIILYALTCGLCVLLGHNQSTHIKKIFISKYTDCQAKQNIAHVQEKEFHFAICMRNSKDIKINFVHRVLPELTKVQNFKTLVNINNLFDQCKNFLTLILPITVIIFSNVNLLKNTVNGTHARRMLFETMFFIVAWHYSYSIVVSSLLRSFVDVNISGHVILLPIIISYVYMIVIECKQNNNPFILLFAFVFMCGIFIHIGFTCLYFHSFEDIVYGMGIGALYQCMILCGGVGKILEYLSGRSFLDNYSQCKWSTLTVTSTFIVWIAYQLNGYDYLHDYVMIGN
jgi:hypothetical protein